VGGATRRKEEGARYDAAQRRERGGGVRPTAGPGRRGAGSSSVGAREQRERGGGPVREKMADGPARGI
jgi:hypothetical protein